MFLSGAIVPVFTFAILLNFLYLYSPIESVETSMYYGFCEQCLKSKCHLNSKRPCYSLADPDYKFTCFLCNTELGNLQFYSEEECKNGCTDETKHCVCNSRCYTCVPKVGFDTSDFAECNIDPNEEITCTSSSIGNADVPTPPPKEPY